MLLRCSSRTLTLGLLLASVGFLGAADDVVSDAKSADRAALQANLSPPGDSKTSPASIDQAEAVPTSVSSNPEETVQLSVEKEVASVSLLLPLPDQPSGCGRWPLMSQLLASINKITNPSGQSAETAPSDPLVAAAEAVDALEEAPDMLTECPGGVVTALVYTSISQETEMKYGLLWRATYLLFSLPDMHKDAWPVKDELIRTLYANTEGKKPLLTVPKRVRAPPGTDVSFWLRFC